MITLKTYHEVEFLSFWFASLERNAVCFLFNVDETNKKGEPGLGPRSKHGLGSLAGPQGPSDEAKLWAQFYQACRF